MITDIRVVVHGDFNTYPIKLSVSDDDKTFQPQYHWSWAHKLSVNYWYSTPKIGRDQGRPFSIMGKVSENPSPFGKLSGDSVKIDLDFRKEHQPSTKFEKICDYATDYVEFPHFMLRWISTSSRRKTS
ncbi:uncharacterized protein ATNIH1004_006525 [Aspergillus tanneri]|uniref:Uncharacterized protein n=1 Tax=Aspergillus tanneri TaxID=1220188 RepID=A0A5M9MSH3_9EURO|nr:uncharacterized protein ATNIH1004_006525 [Aspergillus tanneri]KAA8647823.1 hypothetical protein ATNIH1004_006525 [Aspergillus tanneri]